MRLFKAIFAVLLLTCCKALAQTPNIGFEDGTFNHWECYIGSVDLMGKPTVYLVDPIPDKFGIIGNESEGLIDSYVPIPVRCPNGSRYSIKLGNDTKGPHAERVTYTLTVPAVTSYSIVFDYAVVLVNPGHLPYQQPKFTMQVYDVTDDKYLDCPSFNFVSSSDLPGFKQVSITDTVFYKDWSSATINLSKYTGKTVRLEFTTNACVFGAHFGYAYLDVNEDTGSPITGNANCGEQRSITLHAPFGFAGYKWYDNGFTQKVGEGQNMSISPGPSNGTRYAVIVSPYLGVGCVDTLYTLVNKIDEGFKLAVADTIKGCPGGGVDLTAASVTTGSSPGMQLSYFKDSLASVYLPSPGSVIIPGTYYIQGINKDGCMNILPVLVTLNGLPLIVNDPKAVDFPKTTDLSKTFLHQDGLIYSYFNNANATIPADNYTAIKQSGTYYIKAENSAGCSTIQPVNVIVNPPAPINLTAPNTFTPNNDGINDHFNIIINGSGTFNSLKIYDRYGRLVFTAKSPMESWDGNYNGQKLPTGVYYWLFEGEDDYYKKKINKAAYITLLR